MSIVQGVALFFLTDSTRLIIDNKNWFALPYAAAGLLMIFTVWSRSIMHALTIVRWPIEFIHNFIYIGIALCEAVLFTSMNDPLRWFGASSGMIVIVWFLYIFDLRMIRRAAGDAADIRPATAELFGRVVADQIIKIRLGVPLMFIINAACAAAIALWPQTLVAGHWHVALIFVQMAVLAGYLFTNIRNFNHLAPLILAAQNE